MAKKKTKKVEKAQYQCRHCTYSYDWHEKVQTENLSCAVVLITQTVSIAASFLTLNASISTSVRAQ